MPVEVIHEHDQIRRRVNVYVIRTNGWGARWIWRPDSDAGEGQWLAVDTVNERHEPSLVLGVDVWEALASAAADALPPSAATDRHLADAIGVRDRLLVMAEQAAGVLASGQIGGDDA